MSSLHEAGLTSYIDKLGTIDFYWNCLLNLLGIPNINKKGVSGKMPRLILQKGMQKSMCISPGVNREARGVRQ